MVEHQYALAHGELAEMEAGVARPPIVLGFELAKASVGGMDAAGGAFTLGQPCHDAPYSAPIETETIPERSIRSGPATIFPPGNQAASRRRQRKRQEVPAQSSAMSPSSPSRP